jgi:integrase
MRVGEIASIGWGSLITAEGRPLLQWLGKGKKSRRARPSESLIDVLKRWHTVYESGLGRPITNTDPLVCPAEANHRMKIAWGEPYKSGATSGIWSVITVAAKRAGLGHVAPHDLRRTTAALLHRDRDDQGRHRFDLLDIQQVLGHSDPAVTMRCYLEPLDVGTLDAAAVTLDW